MTTKWTLTARDKTFDCGCAEDSKFATERAFCLVQAWYPKIALDEWTLHRYIDETDIEYKLKKSGQKMNHFVWYHAPAEVN